MIKKYYLLSPGPTPIPDEVLAAAANPIIHHRTPEFSGIFMEVTEGLKYVFGTEQDVFVLTSSGTGAMEAAVINTLSPGDKVIVLNGGKFGERWGQICRSYGVDVREVSMEWGEPFTKDQLTDELKAKPETKAVFATLSETSSGTVYDIQGYGEVLAKSDAILVVDGISGLGATPCP
ncbi:MAG: aminotransferase class V-fold PLP-dependent enzyme, partial [Candidatus Aminicenantes bacterium]|nr:aminotransferase class V-fold PLP-dependent enzyme [Candidatus Aminicenantes bacterium]